MKPRQLPTALRCVLALACAQSFAAPVPPEILKQYAGDYSAKCTDPTALRARIGNEGLSLIRGDKKVVGIYEMEALSYMGPQPPKGYATTLMSNAKGAGSIVFIMYASKGGPMVDLETDAAVLKRVGVAKRGTVKYKRCPGNA